MQKYLLLISFLILSACNDDKASETTAVNSSPQVIETTKQIKPSNKSLKREKIEYSDLTEFKVLSITEGLFENAPALQVNLTLPVDGKQDVDSLIKVYTGKENNELVKGGWIYDDNNSSLYFPFIEAETHYKIFLNKDLLAFNGKKIVTGLVKGINTRPYQKSVRFISQGSTLLKDSNILPIEAVNVAAVDLKFWRIKPDKYAEFLQMSYRNEIYSLQRMYKLGEVVYTAQFELKSSKNKREKHDISIKNIEQVQKAGLYFVTMMPHDLYSYKIQSTWFVSTDIGLHTRKYKQSMAVFTHQIPQAKPYKNVDIKLVDDKGQVLEQAKTDAQGFAEINNFKAKNARFILAQTGDNFNLIRLNQARMDLSEFNLPSRMYHALELFLYSPRDLYRPGETININGLLKTDDGEFIKPTPIKVVVRRPDNRIYKSFNWQGDESSLYTSEFSLPKNALRGRWSFIATLGNKDVFEYLFSVEDFMPERLKLDLNAEKTIALKSSKKAVIKVQSDYLYGAPASENRYDATVNVYAQTRLFDQFKDYEFGSKNYRDYNLNFNLPMQKLDKQGKGKLVLKNQWQQTKFPLRVNTHVNVYESGGRPISRNIVQTIWPYDVAIGVRASWLMQDFDYASPNSQNEIELIAVNQNGQKIAMDNVDVLLIRENNQRYWHWGDDGWGYNSSVKNVAVYNTMINIKKDQITKVALPLEYGSYRVELRDNKRQLISSYQFFSGWRWYDVNNRNGERPDQVKLAWLGDNLSSLKQAQLKITAPYKGLAVVTIEDDKILWKKTVELSNAEQVIDIDIDKAWKRHDIYASVMVIREGNLKTSQQRKHLPARSFGVIHLPLDRDERKLELTLEHPQKVLPESQVTIQINAKNIHSKNSYVTLFAVDTGVLNVSNFKTPKPHHWFFAPRKYIAEIRDMYGAIIALGDGLSTRQKFGGDADLSRGGDTAQADVQIVSLYNDKVKFNQQGVAEITLDLPYFNGELRLMAMAYNDNQFAGVDSLMKVAAPVVISASMPRFIANKDETFAVIDVHNTQDSEQTITLDINADSALGNASINKTIVLKPQQKEILKLPIVATRFKGIGKINLQSKVISQVKGKKDYQIQRTWQLNIRPAYPAVTNSKSVVLDANRSFTSTLASMENFDDNNFKSVLKISNTPVLNAEQHLKGLIQYPYGCLEQTSSRLLPLLQIKKSDLSLFNDNRATEIFAKKHELIENSISKVLSMQRYDGSFGLWSNNSPEEKWLTVYVTEILLKAKDLGYNVPEKSLKNAIKRLQKYVKGRSKTLSDISKYLTNKQHYLLAHKAYAAYVLASIKQINLQDIRQLYDKKHDFAKTGLPLTHLAFALETMGDERRANESWLKAFDFKKGVKSYYYYGDYGTSVRDFSQIILLASRSKLVSKLPTTGYSLITPLLEHLKGKKWFSTQERASLFALAKALEVNKNSSNWSAKLSRNNHSDDYQQNDDLIKVWYEKGAKETFSITNTSEKPLYLDVKSQGYYKNAVNEENGITIERHYFDIKGKEISINQLKTGQLVVVHLAVSLDKKYNYLPDAMIIELMPAGLELENQNLAHSYKIDDLKLGTKTINQWRMRNQIKNTQYLDDRFVSALSLSQYHPSHAFYLARAVTPGKYTIPPTLVEDMYHPEIRAVSQDAGMVEIVE